VGELGYQGNNARSAIIQAGSTAVCTDYSIKITTISTIYLHGFSHENSMPMNSFHVMVHVMVLGSATSTILVEIYYYYLFHT
jgi:hypothetical protein